MDNLVAIGLGLGLRALIDTVTHHNHRVDGSLVGLWEGAVLRHFVSKYPSSLDPYVAYGFRLLRKNIGSADVEITEISEEMKGSPKLKEWNAPEKWMEEALQVYGKKVSSVKSTFAQVKSALKQGQIVN